MELRMSDREQQWSAWMLAWRKGDGAAYKQLLADLARYLRGFARRGSSGSGLDAADVEDIVQETLMAIHMKGHTWNSDELFGPWLRAIARYKIIDSIRRRSGRRHVDIDDYANALAAENDEPQIPARDILKMASSLPEKQKAVVEAIFVSGDNTAEAAQRLSMSEGAVRVSLHRALAALGKRYGKQE
jgi:RNA polymerase sigma-70 factor (ECF subfamily)